jgi:hypothetical protein
MMAERRTVSLLPILIVPDFAAPDFRGSARSVRTTMLPVTRGKTRLFDEKIFSSASRVA